MKTIITAWIFGVGIIVYRDTFKRTDKAGKHVIMPPQPKEVAVTAAFFGLLVLLSEAVPDSHGAVATLAWGVDLAAVIALVTQDNATPSGGTWPPGYLAPQYILPNGNPDYNVGAVNDKAGGGGGGFSIGGVLGGALKQIPIVGGILP